MKASLIRYKYLCFAQMAVGLISVISAIVLAFSTLTTASLALIFGLIVLALNFKCARDANVPSRAASLRLINATLCLLIACAVAAMYFLFNNEPIHLALCFTLSWLLNLLQLIIIHREAEAQKRV